jgi:hypothetical protein
VSVRLPAADSLQLNELILGLFIVLVQYPVPPTARINARLRTLRPLASLDTEEKVKRASKEVGEIYDEPVHRNQSGIPVKTPSASIEAQNTKIAHPISHFSTG